MREDLVQRNRSLDVEVVLSMRTKGFLLDDSGPLGRLVWQITLDKCSLDLARLTVSLEIHPFRCPIYHRIVSRMESSINLDEPHHTPSSSSKFDDCPFTPLDPVQWSSFCIFSPFILTSPSFPSVRHVESSTGEDQILRRREISIRACDDGS